MSDQPKPAGEWTVETVQKLWHHGYFKAIADAHNAALAAERVKWNDALEANRQTEKLLAAEREIVCACLQRNRDEIHQQQGIDTGGLIEAARTIKQLREQLATEREKVQRLLRQIESVPSAYQGADEAKQGDQHDDGF